MHLDIISLEMGYGHLRAAYPIADALGCPLYLADEPPIANDKDSWLWQLIRRGHSFLSRPGESDWLVRQANALMDLVTIIPPMHEKADQSKPDFATKFIAQLIKRGLGRGLVEYLRARKSALLTTIYAPALVANAADIERIYCIVTDADVQRVWVPYEPKQSRIHYFAPSTRVAGWAIHPRASLFALRRTPWPRAGRHRLSPSPGRFRARWTGPSDAPALQQAGPCADRW